VGKERPCFPRNTSTEYTEFQIEGILAYFTHLKCQKCIEDDVGDVGYIFTPKITPWYVLSTLLCKNMTPNAWYLKVFKIC
jgi:hypothetical protein